MEGRLEQEHEGVGYECLMLTDGMGWDGMGLVN
jgi:hypothetical protein